MQHPDWLGRGEYPFEHHVFETDHGRMHYVDEGSGEPILMVHGTPTWSFLYRRLIRELSRTHRCIAPDHLGFGLSDKPPDAPYRPEDHARRLASLIDQLNLRDITLVVHDFGGPIGLACALERPHTVRRLVLFNTWMWSLRGNRAVEHGSRLLGSGIGRLLYTRLNFSPRVMMKLGFADRSMLTRELHAHYLRPFPAPRDRRAPWVLARELIGSSEWYDRLWRRRELLRDTPALLLWGRKDPAFKADALDRWTALFSDARVAQFPDAGHFVQEEAGDVATEAIRGFLGEAG